MKWLYEQKKFTPEMLAEPQAKALMNETNRVLIETVQKGITKEIPLQLTQALENNVFIFSGFKTYHELHQASMLLKDESGGIKPFQKYIQDVQKIDNTYNRSYLEAEYNHATHSAQMVVKWNDFEQDGDRYYLQYRTAADEKVREEHALLHETTLPVDDPFWSSYMPPNGWNCRCNVVQVRKEKYPQSNSEVVIAKGDAMTNTPKNKIFRFNPGKEMKIFPEKHPYFKANKEVGEVIENIQKSTDREAKIQTTKKAKEWVSQNITAKQIKAVNDITYNLEVSKNSFNNVVNHLKPQNKHLISEIHKELPNRQFLRVSELGEGKDMKNPKDVANIEKKKARGVLKYHYYTIEMNNEQWILQCEVVKKQHKKDNIIVEKAYSIKKSYTKHKS